MEKLRLSPLPNHDGTEPIILIIMDGVGLYRGRADGYEGNAVDIAETPNLDRMMKSTPVFLKLAAHGRAVGLPSDTDMGNSEVGHNALGAGRVFEQGAKLVNSAIGDGSIFRGEAWRDLVAGVRSSDGTFHLLGLLSDGNVHSHIDHLFALLRELADEGVQRVRVHALADGRDVEPVSYHRYVSALEDLLTDINHSPDRDFAIASGGGRMNITMDRYNADWDMVRRGWETHVLGRGRGFESAAEAIKALREENPGVNDQDLGPYVVVDAQGRAVGPIEDGDSVVLFNFRGDRSIEISRAFTEQGFAEFDRIRVPTVLFAGMMEYDGDLHIPPRYLVEPPAIDHTLSEYLVGEGVTQLAVAETQKFGHVTYFWNGNNSEKFDPSLEDWVEIPSDNVPFDTRPEMKANEVCDVVERAVRGRTHRFIRVNFANGDMVGHTGSLTAAVKAMEVVDRCLGRIERAVTECGGLALVTADHGNLDMMFDVDSKTGLVKLGDDGRPVAKTSHTLSPVPCFLIGSTAGDYEPVNTIDKPGLGNVAASLLILLGFQRPEDYLPPLFRRR